MYLLDEYKKYPKGYLWRDFEMNEKSEISLKKSPESCNPCDIALALEVFGGKWKGSVIWWVKDGPRRFNELRRLIPEVSQRTLTKTLRELERDGLIERHQYAEIPPRVEYSATRLCQSVIPVLAGIQEWGKGNGRAIEKSRMSFND